MSQIDLGWAHQLLTLIRADLVAPVGFVIAVAVTIHVLLTKRDVGTSIGWIGLAWLSPIIGGVVYFVLGINRVRRRAQTLRASSPDGDDDAPLPQSPGRDDHLAPLEHAARRITLRPA